MGKEIKDNAYAQLLKILPLISLLILVFGLGKLFIYYVLFNYNIIECLETGELLPQVLYDFITASFYILINFYYVNHITDFLINKKTATEENRLGSLGASRSFNFSHLIVGIIFFIICSALLCITLWKLTNVDLSKSNGTLQFKAFTVCLNLAIGTVITVVFTFHQMIKEKTIIDKSSKVIIIFSIIVLLNSIVEGIAKYYLVNNDDLYNGSYIVLDGKRITSNTDTCYIGRSKSNVFFYIRKEHSVNAYSTSHITEVSIKQK
ncbi:hypothetical protein [Mucilaginibacter sp. SP1R1]|uniref:hypothetical protein n=1 Tax=Mucilaginibacter sp. SP1R1 TaxID=2723091 RepID=UPI00160ACF6F|nr:hypothetical protein [Mucilaginibacter sp. SP1R1]MBB6147462.1 hypothetical protein [Mucilaginibacter sp. SP1R1]